MATPLGVALAMGLTRWRVAGQGRQRPLPCCRWRPPRSWWVSALYLVFTNLYQFIPLGRPAQLLGHVTFSISYVVVIVRGRLLRSAASTRRRPGTWGRTRAGASGPILVPLLMPAVFAVAMIVFAASLDDFVVSQFLFGRRLDVTVPIKLYSAVRNAPSPALNALATIMLVGTGIALFFAWLVLRRRSEGSALRELAAID